MDEQILMVIPMFISIKVLEIMSQNLLMAKNNVLIVMLISTLNVILFY